MILNLISHLFWKHVVSTCDQMFPAYQFNKHKLMREGWFYSEQQRSSGDINCIDSVRGGSKHDCTSEEIVD